MIYLIVLIMLGIMLLALFLWNRSITPTTFELRGAHIVVREKCECRTYCDITFVINSSVTFKAVLNT